MAKQRKHHHKRPHKRRWKTSRILTWGGLACLGAAIVILGFFAFTGGDEGPRRSLRQDPVVSTEGQVEVKVVDNDYEPRDLTVQAGTEITWVFDGDVPHTVTEDQGSFDSRTLQSGDTYVRTFDEPGTYYYYCTLHHAMQGKLIVQP